MVIKSKLMLVCIIFLILITPLGCSEDNDEKLSSIAFKNNNQEMQLELEKEKIIYTIDEKEFDTEFIKIKYPQIDGLKDKSIQDAVNEQLQNALKVYEDEANAIKSLLEVNYEITRKSDNIFSVLFRGEQSFESGKINIQKGMNFDLRTSNQINSSNLIKDNEEAKKVANKLIENAAKEKGLEDVVEIECWLGLYFEEENAVFYFMKENETKFNEIRISYNEIKPYMREKYGEKPQ